MLYPFVFKQFQAENRYALFLELLYGGTASLHAAAAALAYILPKRKTQNAKRPVTRTRRSSCKQVAEAQSLARST